MAELIKLSDLTLNTEEARESSELVFEGLYVKPELAEVHDVQTGVEMDKRIPILGQFGLVGKLHAGSCASNTSAEQIPTSEKTWVPKLIEFRLIHCEDDVPNLMKFWKKARVAAGTWEEVNNEMMQFIIDTAMDATLESILRIADFADTDASPIGDATGDEQLTVGVDKTFFNMLDGMWKQIYTFQAGASAAEMYRHVISENAEATKVAQLDLAADAALLAFRAMYNKIDPRAFKSGQLTFQITRTLFNNWQDYLEDKSIVFQLDRTETGATKFSYRGIPIIVRHDWDRNILSYFDNGTIYQLPHRAILTDLMNIPVGTSDEESMKTLKSHYDPITKKHYLDVAYKIDMKILLEFAMAVAY